MNQNTQSTSSDSGSAPRQPHPQPVPNQQPPTTQGTAVVNGYPGQQSEVKVDNMDSFNHENFSVADSYNDHSSHHVDNRKHYRGVNYDGDDFTGHIIDSIVGGRGNTNHVINSGGPRYRFTKPKWEVDMQDQIRRLQEQVEARKKEVERKKKLEEELRKLKAELEEI